MRAARLVGPRQWEMVDVPRPEPGPDQMLVHVERTAVCGTDKPHYCGVVSGYPLPPGTPGHEALGTVEHCPGGAYEAGERVLLWGCDRGLYQEYVLAPVDGCIRLPRDVPPETVLMSQLLGTVIHCFYKLGNVINQQVVVVGQGPVGLLFDAVLRNLGAARIIGVEPLEYRRKAGLRMGATHVIDPNVEDPAAGVARCTDGAMADLVVEAVGIEATYDLCSSLARRRGTVVFFGVPNKENLEGRVSIRLREMFGRELRLINTVGPEPLRDYTIARDWIVQGRIDLTPVVSHVLPLEQIQQAFEMAFDQPAQHDALKIVLTTD